MTGAKRQVPYRNIFRKFNIPLFSTEYLRSVIPFVTYLTRSTLQEFDSVQKIKLL
jgi:hypothetical protein